MHDNPPYPDSKSDDVPKPGSRDFAVSLMEHLAVATFVLDLEGRVIIWNRACERLTGIAASEVLGTSNHWRAFYDDPRETLADLVLQHRASETESLYVKSSEGGMIHDGLSAENWCEMPGVDGHHYLLIDSGPIYDSTGKLFAVVETLRDITEQKKAQIALEQLIMQDGLTGLANRRCFDQVLDTEWRRCKRERQQLALLFIDVDNFKSYNDTHGHLEGDDCLKRIASVLTAALHRAGDLSARYGGEEFAMILPNQTKEGALRLAEQVRCAVENMDAPKTLALPAKHITVSIGVAVTTGAGDEGIESLIAAADEAMYQAKHSGRNQVVMSQIV